MDTEKETLDEIATLREAGYGEKDIADYYRKELASGGFSDPEINSFLNEYMGAKYRSLNGDEQSEQIKQIAQTATPEAVEDDDISFKRLLELGYQQSVTGMLQRGKTPDEISAEEYEKMGIFDRAVMNVASVVSDLPLYAAGAKVGSLSGGLIGSFVPGVGNATGAVLGAGAGAFRVQASARQILVDSYSRGEVMSADELMYRVKNASKEFLKGYAIGMLTSGAGIGGKLASGKLAIAAKETGNAAAKTALKTAAKAAPVSAEIFGMTTASAGLDARVPTAQDFIDCATTIGLLKLTYATSGRVTKASSIQLNKFTREVLPKLYKKFVQTGKAPEQK